MSKTWPKGRVVRIKEQTYYRVDARRTGTSGRQETFKSQKQAEGRAAEIATQFGTNGKEGLAFPAELRGMALTAGRVLRPYGKTLLQAVDFYKAHLDADKKRKDSALVPVLAQEWYANKQGGKTKHLRATILKGSPSSILPTACWSWNTSRLAWMSFHPDYHSRNICPIVLDPQAECPRFVNELLRTALNEDDMILL